MALSSAAGARNRKIVFQRKTVVTDDFGGETETWAAYVTAYASVSFGTGQERRTAAQEGGSVRATFRVPDSPKTRALTDLDRIQYMGAAWDIESIVPAADEPLNSAIDVTATRAA